MSGRIAPAARSRSRSWWFSSSARIASRFSSSVGVNVPASRMVSEAVSASTSRRMKPANAVHGSPSSANAASAPATYSASPSPQSFRP